MLQRLHCSHFSRHASFITSSNNCRSSALVSKDSGYRIYRNRLRIFYETRHICRALHSWFYTAYSAKSSRYANTASNIGSDARRRTASCNNGTLTTAAATCCMCRVVRIIGNAINFIAAFEIQQSAELRLFCPVLLLPHLLMPERKGRWMRVCRSFF